MIQTVEGTGHSFSNPKGRAAVRENTEAWLKACFPQNDLKAEEVTSQSLGPRRNNHITRFPSRRCISKDEVIEGGYSHRNHG